MSAPIRILVAACSATKADPGWRTRKPDGTGQRNRVALVDLYQGPAWRQIRRRYAAGGMLADERTQVWALSALHGLVPSYHHSDTYDCQLTTEVDAIRLADSWLRDPDESRYFANTLRGAARARAAAGLTGEAPLLSMYGGRLYGIALERYLENLDRHHGLRVSWRRFEGGIGVQLGALRRYLESDR